MNVRLTEDAKKVITISEIACVKALQEELAVDDGLYDYTDIALSIIADDVENFIIFDRPVWIFKNDALDDYYCKGSGKMDVMLEFCAVKPYGEFYFISVPLSVIRYYDGTEETCEIIRNEMKVTEIKSAVALGV